MLNLFEVFLNISKTFKKKKAKNATRHSNKEHRGRVGANLPLLFSNFERTTIQFASSIHDGDRIVVKT